MAFHAGALSLDKTPQPPLPQRKGAPDILDSFPGKLGDGKPFAFLNDAYYITPRVGYGGMAVELARMWERKLSNSQDNHHQARNKRSRYSVHRRVLNANDSLSRGAIAKW